jgi:hypothetical protein
MGARRSCASRLASAMVSGRLRCCCDHMDSRQAENDCVIEPRSPPARRPFGGAKADSIGEDDDRGGMDGDGGGGGGSRSGRGVERVASGRSSSCS